LDERRVQRHVLVLVARDEHDMFEEGHASIEREFEHYGIFWRGGILHLELIEHLEYRVNEVCPLRGRGEAR